MLKDWRTELVVMMFSFCGRENAQKHIKSNDGVEGIGLQKEERRE
jgi:hypothetical protein